MEKNRIEAFSDGVFAIAITLLVLDIRIPELSESSLGALFIQLLPNILAYILSFIIIGVYWVAHHSMMHFIRIIDRNALWLNNLTLLAVAFMPFPTSLLSRYHSDPRVILVYCGTISMCNIAGSLFWYYASKHKKLTDKKLSARFSYKVLMLHLLPVLVYCLAAVVSFYNIIPAYIMIIAVPAFFILPNPFLNSIMKDPYRK